MAGSLPVMVLKRPSAWDGWRPAMGLGLFRFLAGETFARGGFRQLIVCILLAACAGLAFGAQRRLREAAYRLRALEDMGSTARVRMGPYQQRGGGVGWIEVTAARRTGPAYQARERALRQQIATVS